MSQIDYSLPEFCERKEYVRFPPDQPFQIPASGVEQRKNGIVYTINDRTGIYDYANAYFKVSCDVRLKTVTGQNEYSYVATDKASLINGIHSLINRISVSGSDGRIVYEYVNANRGNNLKKILTYSPDYAQSVATNEFFYFDNTDTVDSTGHTQRTALTVSAVATNQPTKLNYNIPMSTFGYFDSLKFNNVFLTGQQLRISVDIETDNNLVFRANGKPDGKVVITTMDLMIPQLTLHADAYSAYISSIETPIEWTYMRERIEPFGPTKTTAGRFKITGVNEPQELLFWFLDSTKLNDQTKNPYIADKITGGIGSNKALTTCRLEFAIGEIYPRVDYVLGTDKTDISRLYTDVQEYVHGNDNLHAGSLLSRELFENLYSCVYFDLKYQKRQLVSDVRDFTFVYNIDGTPTNDYYVYCLIKYKETATFGKVNNQYVITSEVGSNSVS